MKSHLRGLSALLAVSLVGLGALAGGSQAAQKVAPVNTAPPTISGTPTVGQTLTPNNGTWSNSPTSFAYQWLRCNRGGNSCASIAGATQKWNSPALVDIC